MEVARAHFAGLELHYDYLRWKKAVAWPVVDLHLKYIRPLRFRQRCRVTATLTGSTNCLKIRYVFRDAESGAVVNKAERICRWRWT